MDVANAYSAWGISEEIVEQGRAAEQELKETFQRVDRIKEINQLRVLKAMQDAKVSESGFGGTTGYGYDDLGREQLETAFAQAFGAEQALVRVMFTTGTQAIAACLFGNLRPGDELLSVTGAPYDTLSEVIGFGAAAEEEDGETADDAWASVPGGSGSLKDFGISFRQVDMANDGGPAWDLIASSLRPQTRMVLIQRSRGYASRRALSIDEIERLVQMIRAQAEDVIIMVDNCYGEFVEEREPCMVGADLCAGSLIKNPGGGIAPGGGYVVGRSVYVERAAARLTAPGLGSHVGPTFGMNRSLAQGFFLAPHVVAESLKGLAFAAKLFEAEGLESSPEATARRGDIIQTLRFRTAEDMIAFCQGVQRSAPVDSFVSPVPAPMPGYDCDVIMAAGAFIQGSSLELSADGPVKPPYMAFMQGGLVYEQVKLAVFLTLQKMKETENDQQRKTGLS